MSYDFGVTETDPDVTDAFSHATIQHDNTMYMCMYMFAPYSHRFTPVHTCECAKKSGLDSRKGRGPWLWPLRRVSFSYARERPLQTYICEETVGEMFVGGRPSPHVHSMHPDPGEPLAWRFRYPPQSTVDLISSSSSLSFRLCLSLSDVFAHVPVTVT